MQWHLLNQFYVSMDYGNSKISVLEEVVSSDPSLVQVLVSGVISSKTMMLFSHGTQCFNQTEVGGL